MPIFSHIANGFKTLQEVKVRKKYMSQFQESVTQYSIKIFQTVARTKLILNDILKKLEKEKLPKGDLESIIGEYAKYVKKMDAICKEDIKNVFNATTITELAERLEQSKNFIDENINKK